MLNIYAARDHEIEKVGQQFARDGRSTARTFEGAAQWICESMFRTFVLGDQSPLFALFRIYRICTHHQLPPDIRIPARADSPYWFALAGTYGVEPAWQDRKQSKTHQAIPEALGRVAPMFRAGISQLRLKWGQPGEIQMQSMGAGTVQYFYVPEAEGSPYILDQEQFVLPYGIHSVIGIGSVFLSGAAYIAFGFTRASLEASVIEKWTVLAPHVSTLLGNFDNGKLWG
ncbi:MAG: hypothetical protein U0670_21850 [Anaerolineae bacterium]